MSCMLPTEKSYINNRCEALWLSGDDLSGLSVSPLPVIFFSDKRQKWYEPDFEKLNSKVALLHFSVLVQSE